MIDALAAKPCFVGGLNWRVVALIPFVPDGWAWWQVLLAGFAVFVLYVVVVAGLWYLFLEMFDKRTPAEREFNQREDDEDQARFLENHRRGSTPKGVFSEADKAFFRFLKAMVPDGEGPKILYVDHPNVRKAYRVRPGGFVLVRGPYEEVVNYFKSHHWERLPFVFQGRHIYRRPHVQLVKSRSD